MDKNRFVISREYVVSLFPIFQLVDSLGDSIKKTIGTNIGEFSGILQEHSIWWVANEVGWLKGHRAVVKRINRDPKWLGRILRVIEKKGIALGKLAKSWASGDLTKISAAELFKRYKQFVRQNTELYNIALVCPLLDYQSSTYISDLVNEILTKKLTTKQVGGAFTLLTTSRRWWPDKKQELALVKIYTEIIKDKFLKKNLLQMNNEYFLNSLLKNNRKLYQRLSRHGNIYAYLTYVYEGPAVALDFYVDVMRDWLIKNIKPDNLVKKHLKNKLQLVKDQKKLLDKLNLTSRERLLIKFAQDVYFVKPYRRLLQSRAYYNFEPVLREISRRLNLTLRQARYLLPEEVRYYLNGGKRSVAVLNERIKSCVYINKDGRKSLLVGRAVEKFWKTVKQEKVSTKVRELKGSTAYPGKISGRVTLVNMPSDMVKMKPGDILVSTATSPNLMAAIRQAAAIVTDEGGITCHAAIVSRELKIPCLIGTKIATRVLKDGDRVEVDATKGLIRKI